MESFLEILKGIGATLMDNLLHFRYALDNPWIWIIGVIIIIVLYQMWGFKKLFFFLVMVTLLILGRLFVESRLAGASADDLFITVGKNVGFYFFLGLIIVYFFFIKQS
jgi:hypothetical protein